MGMTVPYSPLCAAAASAAAAASLPAGLQCPAAVPPRRVRLELLNRKSETCGAEGSVTAKKPRLKNLVP
eukprot:486673-Hanusia_phi.AAC.1